MRDMATGVAGEATEGMEVAVGGQGVAEASRGPTNSHPNTSELNGAYPLFVKMLFMPYIVCLMPYLSNCICDKKMCIVKLLLK